MYCLNTDARMATRAESRAESRAQQKQAKENGICVS